MTNKKFKGLLHVLNKIDTEEILLPHISSETKTASLNGAPVFKRELPKQIGKPIQFLEQSPMGADGFSQIIKFFTPH